MRLGVDVMGGDNAPEEILAGCLEAVELIQEGDVIVLAGQEELIRPGVERAGLASSDKIEILDTREVVAMDDSPVEAVRGKRDSSIVRLAELASPKADEDKRIDAWVSAETPVPASPRHRCT